ncbi:MAG: F0F1 ATP synthase subunit B [Bacteroidota bacterium]
MELITPSIGLVFWMTVSFLTLLFILKKFAWKPILNMLHEREQNIAEALNTAKKAREEMAALKADNERLLNEARLERDKMLKEARDTKDAIIAEAKGKAQAEANKILAQTRETIQTEKNAAITELKNQVAGMSITIAEKILRAELSSDEKQKALVQNLLKDANMN